EYVGVRDLIGMGKGLSVAFAVLVVANALAPSSIGISWGVLVRYFVLGSMALAVGLFKQRLWRETPLAQARRAGGETPLRRRAGAHVRIMPGLVELLKHGSYVHQIRDVRVEDLLPRDCVELDETEVREQLTGETVLVTGAAGSIGSELCHQILRQQPSQLIL